MGTKQSIEDWKCDLQMDLMSNHSCVKSPQNDMAMVANTTAAPQQVGI